TYNFTVNSHYTTRIIPHSLHDALPIYPRSSHKKFIPPTFFAFSYSALCCGDRVPCKYRIACAARRVKILEGVSGSFCAAMTSMRSEEHTSELQSHLNLVCRLLL